MLAALRYRRGQALVVVVLSALVCTGLVLAPLYARALEQATARTLLRDAGPATAGLRLTATSATQPALAPTPDQLVALVPPDLRSRYGTPVTSTAVGVRRMPLAGQPGGRLLSREGMCDHVTFATGRCPTAAGEVAISTDQAASYGQGVGTSLELGEYDGFVSLPQSSPRTTVHVVGTYRQVDPVFWFGDRLTGSAATKVGYDDLLTPLTTLTGPVTGPDGGRSTWFQPQYGADLPLRTDGLGVDEVLDLGPRVADLVAAPYGVERAGSQQAATVSASSGLPALADQVRTGASQAAVTVPLLTAQLEVILGCVLWLVLVAAADQRRGEVAVARLRGRGTRGAQRLLLAETLPQVAVGVPLGALLGAGATTVARHIVLTGDPPFEVPPTAIAVLVIGVLGMVVLVLLSVRRVCREPVADLVRSVPPRRRTFRLGVLEAMLVAAAAAAFVALVTGSVSGPVGQVAPTLLALAVGVVVARLLGLGLPAAGRALLGAGRPAAGTALLTAGRRPTTRWLVPVVTVALSIVVVGVDLLAVGQRNWVGRADAEVGASSVLTLGSSDLQTVARAVHRLDPQARHATPVALVAPSGDQATGGDGLTTMGVVPDEFARLARFPGVPAGSVAWGRLTAPTVAPLVLTGTRATFHLTAPAFRLVPPVIRQAPTALVLALRVVRADGSTDTVALGPVPAAGMDTDVSTPADCGSGCRVTGLGLLPPRGAASVTGTVTVDGPRGRRSAGRPRRPLVVAGHRRRRHRGVRGVRRRVVGDADLHRQRLRPRPPHPRLAARGRPRADHRRGDGRLQRRDGRRLPRRRVVAPAALGGLAALRARWATGHRRRGPRQPARAGVDRPRVGDPRGVRRHRRPGRRRRAAAGARAGRDTGAAHDARGRGRGVVRRLGDGLEPGARPRGRGPRAARRRRRGRRPRDDVGALTHP